MVCIGTFVRGDGDQILGPSHVNNSNAVYRDFDTCIDIEVTWPKVVPTVMQTTYTAMPLKTSSTIWGDSETLWKQLKLSECKEASSVDSGMFASPRVFSKGVG